jgi:hypothetical protein
MLGFWSNLIDAGLFAAEVQGVIALRQPAGPVIEGHADPIDDLLNGRVSLDTP